MTHCLIHCIEHIQVCLINTVRPSWQVQHKVKLDRINRAWSNRYVGYWKERENGKLTKLCGPEPVNYWLKRRLKQSDMVNTIAIVFCAVIGTKMQYYSSNG